VPTAIPEMRSLRWLPCRTSICLETAIEVNADCQLNINTSNYREFALTAISFDSGFLLDAKRRTNGSPDKESESFAFVRF
jgi:hypothetical protein